jgi:CHAD domain-containing protein
VSGVAERVEILAERPAEPSAEPVAAEPRISFVLELPPAQAGRLPRLVGATVRRPAPIRLAWHDTADFALAADGLALLERRQARRTAWRLERPAGDFPAPGAPLPGLAEAPQPQALGHALPAGLRPAVAFLGTTRTLIAGEVELTVLAGRLVAGPTERPCCRALLAGPAAAVAALAGRLAEESGARVSGVPLAAEAIALAGGGPPKAPGMPALNDRPVGEAFALLVAGLTAILLHLAPQAGPHAAEPVHQMRVTMRRLRSAVKLFNRAVRCPELAECASGLRGLVAMLGPARDWDVFTAGTGRAVTAAFPDDAAITAMARAAERRRVAAYAALAGYLQGAEFRRLGIALALLAITRPWAGPAAAEPDDVVLRRTDLLATPLAAFAAHALGRRWRPLEATGHAIATLPPEDLHALRLNCKRLRYAAEFFAPLFPGHGARRFIRRVTELQDRLGHLNDGAVAAALMGELGLNRRYAGGVVRGYVAAHAGGTRAHIGATWRRLHRAEPFWRGHPAG